MFPVKESWGLFGRDDADVFASFGFGLVFDLAVNFAENGMVFAHTDVVAGMELGSALADDDVTCYDSFAAVFFNTQELGIAVTTVSAAANTFFMCHASPRYLTLISVMRISVY